MTCPLTPPEQANTVSPARRFTYKTSSRCPVSGWNGCITTTKPKTSLDDAALCRLRGRARITAPGHAPSTPPPTDKTTQSSTAPPAAQPAQTTKTARSQPLPDELTDRPLALRQRIALAGFTPSTGTP